MGAIFLCCRALSFSSLSRRDGDVPPPPSSKRFRCYSPTNAPIWSSSPSSSLDQLCIAFPLLELTNGSDLNNAIKSLYALVSANEKEAEELANRDSVEEAQVISGSENLPKSGDDWVELLVREVMQSNGADDAKARASRVLEALEKMLSARAREEV